MLQVWNRLYVAGVEQPVRELQCGAAFEPPLLAMDTQHQHRQLAALQLPGDSSMCSHLDLTIAPWWRKVSRLLSSCLILVLYQLELK